MYNFFTHRKQQESAELQSKRASRSARIAVLKDQKNDQLRRVSVSRAVEWAGKHMSQDYARTVKEGGVPLFHPSAHQFRLTPKESSQSIYVRHYVPGKERAEAAATEYNSAYLGSRQEYDRNSPHNHTDWVRKPDPRKFIYGPRTVHKHQDDQSRLKTTASAKRLVTLDGFDRFKTTFPVFRPRSKDKDTDITEFNHFVKGYDKQSTAWSTPGIYDGEHYIDGYAVTGDLTKKRDKSKETNPTDFALTSPKDPWSLWTSPNPSVRDLKSAEQLSKLGLAASVGSLKASTGPSTALLSPKYYMKTYETQVAQVQLGTKMTQEASEKH